MKELYTVKTNENSYYDWYLDKIVGEFNPHCIYSLDEAKFFLQRVKGAKIHPLIISVGKAI